MLSGIMLNIVMLSAIVLNVVMLSAIMLKSWRQCFTTS
jgi:hypothetical protein